MPTTPDIDGAKDRLVDSLSSARDTTVSAVRDDIAPAVVAAVGAARDASAPLLAEAASRTGDAMSALRGSDAAKALRDSDVVAAIGRRGRKRRRRWPFIAGIAAAVGAAAAFAKQRQAKATPPYVTPTSAPVATDKPATPTAG